MNRKPVVPVTAVLPALLLAACDTAHPPGTPVVPGEVPDVPAVAVALGTALDHVAGLPDSREPVRYGSRTFETSGEVLVKVDAAVPGAEAVIGSRGWVLVAESPRICGATWDLADAGGFPYCWLHDAPDALYLRVSSAVATADGGHEIVVHPYRNTRLPEDHDLSTGLIQTNEFNSPTGDFADHDVEGHRRELARLTSAVSTHPGVLSDGGMLRVRVEPDGTAGHTGEYSGYYYSDPNGGDANSRGRWRSRFGPVRAPVSEEERRYDDWMMSCQRFEWNSGEWEECRGDAHEFRWAFLDAEAERNLALVRETRAIAGGEVAR